MYNATHTQVHGAYRQAELLNVLAGERLVRSAGETGTPSLVDRPSLPRRIVYLVTDALSGLEGAIAAAGRRPHQA